MFQKLSVVVRANLLATLGRLPPAWTHRFGVGVEEVEGEPVSARLRWILRLLFLEPADTPHESKRAIYDAIGQTAVAGEKRDVEIEDEAIYAPHKIALRIYRPKGHEGPLPVIFWAHGGGFVIGSITSHDTFCRRLCADAKVAVIAAHYRLGPEHPFPAPHEDIMTVWRWIRAEAEARGFDKKRLCMGGDSAGGNLTAVLCQQLPQAERPAYQILCYPSTDSSRQSASRQRWAKGYLLDRELLDWFIERYCPGEDLADPRISPLLAPSLEGQPPAMMITAGLDPLVDEGLAYADRLEAAGVPVERHHCAPMIHGYITMTGLFPRADREVDVFIASIRKQLQELPHG